MQASALLLKDLTGIVASPVSDFYISKLSWK